MTTASQGFADLLEFPDKTFLFVTVLFLQVQFEIDDLRQIEMEVQGTYRSWWADRPPQRRGSRR